MDKLIQILGNVPKSPWTTAFGAIVLAASFYCVYSPAIAWDWSHAIPGLIIGSYLLFAKDPKKGDNNGQGGNVAVAVMGLLLFACVPPPVKTTISTTDTVTVSLHRAVATIPGFVIHKGLSPGQYDSLVNALKKLQLNGKSDTIYYTDPQSENYMKFYLDKLGELQGDCQGRDKLISYLQKQLKEKKTTTIVKAVTVYKTPWWAVPALSIAIFLTVLTILYILFHVLKVAI